MGVSIHLSNVQTAQQPCKANQYHKNPSESHKYPNKSRNSPKAIHLNPKTPRLGLPYHRKDLWNVPGRRKEERARNWKYFAETAFCDWGSLPMDHMRTADRFLSRATSSFSVCKCAASNPSSNPLQSITSFLLFFFLLWKKWRGFTPIQQRGLHR